MTSPRPSRFGGRASIRTTCGSAQPQLGGVLDRHDPLGGIHERRQRAQRRRLARAGPAADQQRAARARRRGRGSRAAAGASVPCATRSAGANPRGRKRRIVSTGPSSASGGSTTFTREPSGQPRVAQRLGLVGAAAERREDALDHVPQLPLAGEADVGLREPAAALDPHRRRAADEDLVDAGIAQQRLERPEPDRALGDPRRERRARPRVEHARLPLDERADPVARVVAARRVARAVDEPLAERAGEVVERVHARDRRAGRVLAPARVRRRPIGRLGRTQRAARMRSYSDAKSSQALTVRFSECRSSPCPPPRTPATTSSPTPTACGSRCPRSAAGCWSACASPVPRSACPRSSASAASAQLPPAGARAGGPDRAGRGAAAARLHRADPARHAPTRSSSTPR